VNFAFGLIQRQIQPALRTPGTAEPLTAELGVGLCGVPTPIGDIGQPVRRVAVQTDEGVQRLDLAENHSAPVDRKVAEKHRLAARPRPWHSQLHFEHHAMVGSPSNGDGEVLARTGNGRSAAAGTAAASASHDSSCRWPPPAAAADTARCDSGSPICGQ